MFHEVHDLLMRFADVNEANKRTASEHRELSAQFEAAHTRRTGLAGSGTLYVYTRPRQYFIIPLGSPFYAGRE